MARLIKVNPFVGRGEERAAAYLEDQLPNAGQLFAIRNWLILAGPREKLTLSSSHSTPSSLSTRKAGVGRYTATRTAGYCGREKAISTL